MSLFNVSHHSLPGMLSSFQVETSLSSQACLTSVKTMTSLRWEPTLVHIFQNLYFPIPEYLFLEHCNSSTYKGGSGPWNGSLRDWSHCRTTHTSLLHSGDWNSRLVLPRIPTQCLLIDLSPPADIASPICSALGCSSKRWSGSCGWLVLSKGFRLAPSGALYVVRVPLPSTGPQLFELSLQCHLLHIATTVLTSSM